MNKLLAATAVVEKLQAAGYIAYFAGGWVRDYHMQHRSDDIDIATSASVEEIRKLFDKTIPVGVAFGIVIVVLQGEHFEVATFRKDRGYVDGRRPTGFDPASPEEDAKRRDFTINGMFYDPISKKLYDFVGGLDDIQRKIIRAIGNPHERFAEDRLRMMRAVRYSTRFKFPIEKATEKAILDHATELLPAVAHERIWQEFKKMASYGHFDEGLILMHRLNLLQTIFPELKEIPQNEIQERMKHLGRFPANSPPFAQLLELFPGLSLEQIEEMAEHLKLSNEEKAFADFYHHAQALFKMPKEWIQKLEKIEWAQFYADPHSEICLQMVAAQGGQVHLEEHQKRRNELSDAIQRVRSKNYYITADDLMKEGIPPGRKMGQLIKEAMRIAVNHDLKDKMLILQKLKSDPLWNL